MDYTRHELWGGMTRAQLVELATHEMEKAADGDMPLGIRRKSVAISKFALNLARLKRLYPAAGRADSNVEPPKTGISQVRL